MAHLNDETAAVDVRMKEATQEAEEMLDELDEQIALEDDEAKIKELTKARTELQAEIDKQRYA